MIEIRDPSIGGNLRVYVSTLLLVKVDLSLECLDLLRLQLQQLFQLLLLLQHFLLHLVVFIHEDSLVRRVKLAVQVKLLFSQLADKVQKVRVIFYGLCQFTLGLLQLAVCLLYHLDAFLLCLVEFILQVKYKG